jgi:ketosteroid isomerase-like protein
MSIIGQVTSIPQAPSETQERSFPGDIRNLTDALLIAPLAGALLSFEHLSVPWCEMTMTTIRPTLGAILLAASAWAQTGSPDYSAQQNKITVLEHLWNDAQVHRDAHALEAMIADRFVNTEYDGEVSDRDKFLADIKDPEFKPSLMNIRDVQVNVYRDTAVVTGVYHTKGTSSGKAYEHLGRFTDTWIFDNGKWLCVASHTSLVKK